MKYLMIGGIVLAVVYNVLSGDMELIKIDDLKTMIPAVPSWLSNIL